MAGRYTEASPQLRALARLTMLRLLSAVLLLAAPLLSMAEPAYSLCQPGESALIACREAAANLSVCAVGADKKLQLRIVEDSGKKLTYPADMADNAQVINVSYMDVSQPGRPFGIYMLKFAADSAKYNFMVPKGSGGADDAPFLELRFPTGGPGMRMCSGDSYLVDYSALETRVTARGRCTRNPCPEL